MDEILSLVEILDNAESYTIERCERDVFEYGGLPADKLDVSRVMDYTFEHFGDGDDKESVDSVDDADDEESVAKNIIKAQKVLEGINYVVAVIYYPVSSPAVFKFDCSAIDVTYGKVLYLYTYAYQHMYKLEHEDGGLHAGRFGIWGHSIGDLAYNGVSTIEYADDGETVICRFSCDS
jgi:hypothetical protein